MSPVRQSRAQAQEIIEWSKEELFAYAYIRHMGNGAAAAREVYGLTNDNSAYVQASRMLRNAKVRKIIDDHLRAQRKHYEKFKDQGPYFLVIAAQRLIQVIQDEKTPFEELIRAIETLTRMVGVELSEAVTIARIKADAVRPELDQTGVTRRT